MLCRLTAKRTRRHIVSNFYECVNDVGYRTSAAVAGLHDRARAAVRHELATLTGLLEHPPTTAAELREALERLAGG